MSRQVTLGPIATRCPTVQRVPNQDIIAAMTTSEKQSEKHTRLAHQLLADAEREIAAGRTGAGRRKTLGRNQSGP